MGIDRLLVVTGTVALILTPFSAIAQEKSHVTSEQVTHATQELEKLAQKQIQEDALPGLAIAIVFQDKAVYAKGFGVRDTSTKVPVDADTVFQLASLSKSIGSTVVAELVGEGKITWDSKLNVLDSSFAMFDPWVTREITIRDMYAHRSGFPEHAGGNFISPALSTSREQFSFALRLHEFWYDRRRDRGGESVRAGVGRGGQTKVVQTARYDFDQLALRGLCRTPEQSLGTRAGEWQMAAKVQTRSRCAIANGRGEFFG